MMSSGFYKSSRQIPDADRRAYLSYKVFPITKKNIWSERKWQHNENRVFFFGQSHCQLDPAGLPTTSCRVNSFYYQNCDSMGLCDY